MDFLGNSWCECQQENSWTFLVILGLNVNKKILGFSLSKLLCFSRKFFLGVATRVLPPAWPEVEIFMSKFYTRIIIQGSVLKASTQKAETSDAAAKRRQTREKKRSTDGKAAMPTTGSVYADRNKGSISRAVRRSKVNFAQLVGVIKNKPTYHIAFVLPRRLYDYEYMVLENCLRRFFKRLTKLYPGSYFIRIFGWSEEAGLHAHVLVRFGVKSSRAEKEHHVREVWKTIVKSNESKIVKMTKFKEGATIGYLTSQDKDGELRVAMQRTQGGRIWTVINRKNIDRYKKFKLLLDEAEHVKFKHFLRLLIADAGLPQSNRDQLEKSDYCLNYLMPSLLHTARKQFLKWRKRHGA
ncbi:hypothetical protein LJB81_00915 [Desulfovibrio sp. OttesenSCG-928-M14]|nr:hypothetical protein [Desulfovibrio sp. OttesenSCG-928-M14]